MMGLLNSDEPPKASLHDATVVPFRCLFHLCSCEPSHESSVLQNTL